MQDAIALCLSIDERSNVNAPIGEMKFSSTVALALVKLTLVDLHRVASTAAKCPIPVGPARGELPLVHQAIG